MTPLEILREKRACMEAVVWVKAHPKMTPERLWATCPRGDWMLWLAARLNVEYATAAAATARSRMHLATAKTVRRRIPWRIVKAALVKAALL